MKTITIKVPEKLHETFARYSRDHYMTIRACAQKIFDDFCNQNKLVDSQSDVVLSREIR